MVKTTHLTQRLIELEQKYKNVDNNANNKDFVWKLKQKIDRQLIKANSYIQFQKPQRYFTQSLNWLSTNQRNSDDNPWTENSESSYFSLPVSMLINMILCRNTI